MIVLSSSMLTSFAFSITFYSFFLEKQMLLHFINIMKQKVGGNVNTQLLQTLNIMFENIRNETSLCKLKFKLRLHICFGFSSKQQSC